MENLISSYQENAKNFDEELSQQQEILGQQIEDLKKAWQKEKDHYWREVQKRNENYQKNKARDIQEYQYNLEQERYLSIDEYEQNKQNLYKELEENRQEQEKKWQQREENLVVSAALKQVQDLAVKAIEGTSNRQSFESIKEIAMEQAKTQNKNK